MIVVSLLAINIMREQRDHMLVSKRIEVVYLVPLVENVRHHLRWRSIDNCRADDIWHVSVIFVFRNVELPIREELANSSKMHITSQNRHANGLCRGNVR